MKIHLFKILLTTIIFLSATVSKCHGDKDFVKFDINRVWPVPKAIKTFFVDSINGNDHNSGIEENKAWQTLHKLSSMTFQPGDQVYFKRNSQFSGCLTVNGNGTEKNPIVIGAFGQGNAPKFTNQDNNYHHGNAIQVRGDHQIIQNLYFHHTAPAKENANFIEVWDTGALHVSLGNDYVIIRGNQFKSTPKAIQSYSEHSLISHNYIKDSNNLQQEGFLSKPFWGPIGIDIGIGNQEIAYNIIENMFVQGGEWDADGGAIEIDDGRYHKNNIHIHHNMTLHNMGFLEISWKHDIKMRPTHNIIVEHNIIRDYQDFVLWWAHNSNSQINHNTIIRTDQINGMFTDTVFFLDGQDIDINHNIIVVSDRTSSPVFQGDHAKIAIHNNNLYWNIDGGDVNLAVKMGKNEFTGNPLFIDFWGQDYRLRSDSIASGLGAWTQVKKQFDAKTVSLEQNFKPLVSYNTLRETTLNTVKTIEEWVKVENTDNRLSINGGNTWYGHNAQNSGGSTQTLWTKGDSIMLKFVGTKVRFHGLKGNYMNTFDIVINGKVVAKRIPASGNNEFQAILWESEILQAGIHSAKLISNGDTVEVDFITYQ